MQSADTLLLAGTDQTPVTSPFNPRTLEPCQRPPQTFECGDPQINSNEDSGLFIWMNCNGTWSVRLTGQQLDGNPINVRGTFRSYTGFEALRLRGIENSDSVAELQGPRIVFNMTTISPWSDGFDVDIPGGSDFGLCFGLYTPGTGLEVFLGPDRKLQQDYGEEFDPVSGLETSCF